MPGGILNVKFGMIHVSDLPGKQMCYTISEYYPIHGEAIPGEI